MKSYDVIFIGSGHACWHGALILKMLGKSVALVERDLVGEPVPTMDAMQRSFWTPRLS